MSVDVSPSFAGSDVERAQDGSYPPLPQSGSQEESDLAQQNYTERERLSKSWRARLFSKHSSDITLLARKSSILSSDSDSAGSTSSTNVANPPVNPEVITEAPTSPQADTSQRLQSFTSESRAIPSQDTSRIALRDADEEDPTKDQHLYSWAMVYENQRGISLFSTRRYSSQSLLPRDPPPFSVATPSPSLVDGSPIRKSNQPNFTLEDFPLPDGNWRWASREWLIDMRDETIQHDGFEYNWFFRSKGWRSKAGRLNSGAWVRRRRWLRLMERPPLSALNDGDGTGRTPQEPGSFPSVDMEDIWRGDDEDWPRLHRLMLRLGRDGRRLEVWKEWVRVIEPSGKEESPSSHRIAERMSTVLRNHLDDLHLCFVFPFSRVELLVLITKAHLLSEAEVLGGSELPPSFVDRNRLEDKLQREL